MKKCAKCGIEKSAEHFYKNKQLKLGLHSYCKECISFMGAARWAGLSPEEKLSSSRASYKHEKQRYAENPEAVRKHRWTLWIMREYGLTEAQYMRIWKKQKGRCAICSCELELLGWPSDKMANVDHCHLTGQVRALLCGPCNKGLGLFKDSLGLLRQAVKYLEKHQTENQQT